MYRSIFAVYIADKQIELQSWIHKNSASEQIESKVLMEGGSIVDNIDREPFLLKLNKKWSVQYQIPVKWAYKNAYVLQKENQELKTEIALLKKMKALVEKRKARLRKTGQWSSKD